MADYKVVVNPAVGVRVVENTYRVKVSQNAVAGATGIQGKGAYSASFTKPVINLLSTNSGEVGSYSNAFADLDVWQGATKLTYDASGTPAANTYQIVSITPDVSSPDFEYTHTQVSSQSRITVTDIANGEDKVNIAVVIKFNDDDVNTTRYLDVTKTKDGATFAHTNIQLTSYAYSVPCNSAGGLKSGALTDAYFTIEAYNQDGVMTYDAGFPPPAAANTYKIQTVTATNCTVSQSTVSSQRRFTVTAMSAAKANVYVVIKDNDTGIEYGRTYYLTKALDGASGNKGDSAVFYYIEFTSSKVIKNNSGTVSAKLKKIIGLGEAEDVTSGNIVLVDENDVEITDANGFNSCDDLVAPYVVVLDQSDVSGEFLIKVRDVSTNADYYTDTIIDITDGVDAVQPVITLSNGYVYNFDGTDWNTEDDTVLTVEFYQGGVLQDSEEVTVALDSETGLVTRTVTDDSANISLATSGNGTNNLLLTFTHTPSGVVISQTIFVVQRGDQGVQGVAGLTGYAHSAIWDNRTTPGGTDVVDTDGTWELTDGGSTTISGNDFSNVDGCKINIEDKDGESWRYFLMDLVQGRLITFYKDADTYATYKVNSAPALTAHAGGGQSDHVSFNLEHVRSSGTTDEMSSTDGNDVLIQFSQVPEAYFDIANSTVALKTPDQDLGGSGTDDIRGDSAIVIDFSTGNAFTNAYVDVNIIDPLSNTLTYKASSVAVDLEYDVVNLQTVRCSVTESTVSDQRRLTVTDLTSPKAAFTFEVHAYANGRVRFVQSFQVVVFAVGEGAINAVIESVTGDANNPTLTNTYQDLKFNNGGSYTANGVSVNESGSDYLGFKVDQDGIYSVYFMKTMLTLSGIPSFRVVKNGTEDLSGDITTGFGSVGTKELWGEPLWTGFLEDGDDITLQAKSTTNPDTWNAGSYYNKLKLVQVV